MASIICGKEQCPVYIDHRRNTATGHTRVYVFNQNSTCICTIRLPKFGAGGSNSCSKIKCVTNSYKIGGKRTCVRCCQVTIFNQAKDLAVTNNAGKQSSSYKNLSHKNS